MTPISVVIITRNETHIIAATINSVMQLTDDVIIVDSGSTDGTQQVAASLGANVIQTIWEGFGANKNKGIAAARYDWILSIDADEQPDNVLLKSLSGINFSNTSVAYNIRFKTFLGHTQIRFGEWGNDAHVRLFSRTKIKWNNAEVHEQLELPADVQVKNINGYILHYTVKDIAEYATKTTQYALLYAERAVSKGKKAGWVKQYLSPAFSFIQNYIIKLGFLDGREGYVIARMTSYYTFLKYARLQELNNSLNKKQA